MAVFVLFSLMHPGFLLAERGIAGDIDDIGRLTALQLMTKPMVESDRPGML